MAKKRKSDSTRLDEIDRGMYSSFCSAANSLSQLYSHAMHQQRLSFQAGERHALEKLYCWIRRKQEDGIRVTPGDIIAYLRNEVDHVTDESPQSPRLALQQNQASVHLGIPLSSSTAFGPAPGGHHHHHLRSADQSKNSVFSNALSSPIRRSLQSYHHLSAGSHYVNDSGRGNNNENNNGSSNNQIPRDPNPPSSNDTSMDMHADSPGHDSPY
ncbi:hypothetical protein M569_10142 [Genlisea aurea]|uniref:Holocarboxylase synthetase n=1 Tax=Genlisea aurea TaxID=192259 RepID=S8CCJ7_9LAMI|nr:hypothetical protein M569_10142 [Genlisea aurea]